LASRPLATTVPGEAGAVTCDGEDISPELRWGDVPANTKSFALISDDPDAPRGTWVHWVLYNIPEDTRDLVEGIPTDNILEDRSRQGSNDFKRIGYGGPCPPPGKPHRYYFKLYALDIVLPAKDSMTKASLEKAMEGHILVQTQLMGRYGR